MDDLQDLVQAAVGYFYLGAPWLLVFVLPVLFPFGVLLLQRLIEGWSNTIKISLVFWSIALGAAVQTVLSTRNLNTETLARHATRLTLDDVASGFLSGRIATLALLALSMAELARGLGRRLKPGPPPAADPARGLLGMLLALLAGIDLFCVIGSTEPEYSYKSLYQPIVLVGMYYLADMDPARFVRQVKWMLLLTMLASLAAAVIAPDFALLRPYAGIPGLSFRLYGVTPHANSLGAIAALLVMLELWFPSMVLLRWINLAAGIVVALLAQSKTVWIAGVGLLVLVYVPYYLSVERPVEQKRRVALLAGIAAILLVVVVTLVLAYAGPDSRELDEAGVFSLTGRTEIWAITWREFVDNPLFGYGPGLWSPEFRYKLGMLHVGQAHNQFVQTLGKSGVIGLALLLGYLGTYYYIGIRYFRASRGLVVALTTFIVFRCLTEAPVETGVILDWAFFVHALTFTLAVHYARQGSADARILAQARQPAWRGRPDASVRAGMKRPLDPYPPPANAGDYAPR